MRHSANISGCTIRKPGCRGAYKVGQVDMTVCVEENVVGLDIAVDDALAVNIPQRAAELGNPEANILLCESLSRNVKSEIAAAHEINHKVPVTQVSAVANFDVARRGRKRERRTCTRYLGSCIASCK